ncbi:MAG: nucleotidyltransferase domain-containing protein [Candidatus Methanoperedens sp.]|nr:nucleotidyltransferase domain-containing protein [Candidatus Methanoperedens sp.]
MQKEYVSLIEEYCSAIKNHFSDRLISICLFGSVARGEAKPDSDIDFLIVTHEYLKKSKAYISLRKSNISGLISDIFFTPEEIKGHPPILLDIIDDGIVLYDRDSFLSKELKLLKRKLQAQKAQKVKTERGHFWILKPDVKSGEVVEI